MSEQVKPYAHSTQSKKEQVATMFDNIAGTYDFLNHFLSAGIDYWWRYVAINQLKDKKPKQILDVATGTGDFALASLRLQPDKIIGIDISDKMLDVARQKIKNKSLVGKYEVLQADSENLPFADASFDAVTVAFGVRNFENLSKGLQEMHRVLQTNGKVIILEFSKPKNFPVKQLYGLYFKYVLPVVGKLFSKDASAYTYLPDSVAAFPEGNDFLALMQQIGYKNCTRKSLTFGISTIYTGLK